MNLNPFKSYLKVILVAFMVISVSGCKKDDATTTTTSDHYYDPKVPFGSINVNKTNVMNVLNLAADVSVLDKVKLTWTIPPIYQTLEHKVVIYKRKTPPEDFNLVCPKPTNVFTSLCPADEVSAAPLYLEAEVEGAVEFINEGTDQITGSAEVARDTDYTYWVFMQINGDQWASGVRLDIHTKAKNSEFVLPTVQQFWTKERFGYGFNPATNNGLNSMYTFNFGVPTPDDQRGGIAFAFSGGLMYVADTQNNRIVVYGHDGLMSCEGYTDEYEKAACLLQFQGAPMTARNVLGQKTGTSVGACGQQYEDISQPPGNGNKDGICDSGEVCIAGLPNNECLTRPTRVAVINNKLYISDSGNDRIVIYNTLPTNGCIQDNGSGNQTPRECTPNKVIGKAGLMDVGSTYTLSGYGKVTLNNPTDVVAKDDKLFIADTGNNRILRIDDFNDLFSFNCTSDSWPGPLCEFDGVLGQPDFFFNDTFNSKVAANPNIVLQTGIKDTIHPDHATILKHYFRHPTRIIFTPDDKMLVLSQEAIALPNSIGGFSALRSRVLIFNTNPIAESSSACNPGTFEAGSCDADDVIGQGRFDKLETIATNDANSYNQLLYGLWSVDDLDLMEVPPAEGASGSTQLLLGVSSVTNDVLFWYNWPDKQANGYPMNAKAVDPEGAPNPNYGTPQGGAALLPNLNALCSIRIVKELSTIFVNDCGGNRLHSIWATDYTSSLPTGN